jgi:hypothetical protein
MTSPNSLRNKSIVFHIPPVRTYLLLMSAPPQNGLLLPGVVSAACQGTEPVSAVQFCPAGQMIRPGVVAIRPHRQALQRIGLKNYGISVTYLNPFET